MTTLTGTPYFPGGIGEFVAPKDEFLVFEQGPSEDVVLQWATYRDASDQCSLSRIWGGIHPPADDIPGRIMGYVIGKQAFEFGSKYFTGKVLEGNAVAQTLVFPNPVKSGSMISLNTEGTDSQLNVFTLNGTQVIILESIETSEEDDSKMFRIDVKPGLYVLKNENLDGHLIRVE